MKSILDATFRYVPSFKTDLRKTFARIRRDDRKEVEEATVERGGAGVNVLPIIRTTEAVRR
jgi:hypothetical protein